VVRRRRPGVDGEIGLNGRGRLDYDLGELVRRSERKGFRSDDPGHLAVLEARKQHLERLRQDGRPVPERADDTDPRTGK
jgi:hypothetical protein